MHSKLMIDVNAMNNEVEWRVCGVETTMKTRENTRTGRGERMK